MIFTNVDGHITVAIVKGESVDSRTHQAKAIAPQEFPIEEII